MTSKIERKQDRAAKELARLALLDRSGCLKLWREWIGSKPPRYLSAVFMRKALAHEAQCRMIGRLPAAETRTLRSFAKRKRSTLRVAPALSVGTHLVREWNGRTYQVEVGQSGFVMDGKVYRSLTAIAKRITGANWSGPRFFGLVDRSDKKQVFEYVKAGTDQAPDTALISKSRDVLHSVSPQPYVIDSEDSDLSASASPESGVSSWREAEVLDHV